MQRIEMHPLVNQYRTPQVSQRHCVARPPALSIELSLSLLLGLGSLPSVCKMAGMLLFSNPCCLCFSWLLCWSTWNSVLCCPISFGIACCTENEFARSTGRAVVVLVFGLPFLLIGLWCMAFVGLFGLLVDLVVLLVYVRYTFVARALLRAAELVSCSPSAEYRARNRWALTLGWGFQLCDLHWKVAALVRRYSYTTDYREPVPINCCPPTLECCELLYKLDSSDNPNGTVRLYSLLPSRPP